MSYEADKNGDLGGQGDQQQCGESDRAAQFLSVLQAARAALPDHLGQQLYLEVGSLAERVSIVFASLAGRELGPLLLREDAGTFLTEALERLNKAFAALCSHCELERIRAQADGITPPAATRCDSAPPVAGSPHDRGGRDGDNFLAALDGLEQAGRISRDVVDVTLSAAATLIGANWPADECTKIKALTTGAAPRERFRHALAVAQERSGLMLLREFVRDDEVEQLRRRVQTSVHPAAVAGAAGHPN